MDLSWPAGGPSGSLYFSDVAKIPQRLREAAAQGRLDNLALDIHMLTVVKDRAGNFAGGASWQYDDRSVARFASGSQTKCPRRLFSFLAS